MVRSFIIAVLLVSLIPRAFAADPATAPTTRADPAILQELEANDAKVRDIAAFSAEFVQEKATPLLRKPLVSTGRVYAKGDRTLWRTDAPEPTRMLIDGREIRIHYPQDRVIEVYPIGGGLAALASSPMPRLDVLRRFFTFERIDAAGRDGLPESDDRFLSVRLTPIDPAMTEHVTEIRITLDRETGYVERGETIDADGDRTTLRFSNVRAGGVTDADVSLDLPPGTRESRPLGGTGDAPAPEDARR